MNDAFDDDSGRSFAGLDIREAQRALAEEMNATPEESDQPTDDQPEASGVVEPMPEHEDAATGANETGAEGEVDAAPAGETEEDPVYSAAEQAAQARMVEALLFAASEPLDEETIAARLPRGADIPAILDALRQHYENRGVHLSKVAGKWRFATAPDVAHVLVTERVEQRKLSRAALETLAIIAYHQPCTRADIEDVRGVMVSKGSLDQLLEIGWVKLKGRRKDVPGRPVLYATTPAFLEHFGLESVSDLPGLSDLRAAGLLDARLPPGFSVPTPVDAGEDANEDDEGEDSTAEFVQDFTELDGDAEAAADEAEQA